MTTSSCYNDNGVYGCLGGKAAIETLLADFSVYNKMTVSMGSIYAMTHVNIRHTEKETC